VSVDIADQFVCVGNEGSANVSEFTLNATTGVLTGVAGSPVAAGAKPDFIEIQ
jgi:6-phosphogluconolactonase